MFGDKSCHKRTAAEFLEALTPKSLRKVAISRMMNAMKRTEQREVRRIVRERNRFYSKLRYLVGEYRETDKNKTTRMKRMDALPYKIDPSDTTCWKFIDATRGIDLSNDKLCIPSIQQSASGRMYLDLRIWRHNEDEEKTTVKPTKKGVCMSIEHLTELRGLLEALDVRWKREIKRREKNESLH